MLKIYLNLLKLYIVNCIAIFSVTVYISALHCVASNVNLSSDSSLFDTEKDGLGRAVAFISSSLYVNSEHSLCDFIRRHLASYESFCFFLTQL